MRVMSALVVIYSEELKVRNSLVVTIQCSEGASDVDLPRAFREDGRVSVAQPLLTMGVHIVDHQMQVTIN
jgi:hypothetical protein